MIHVLLVDDHPPFRIGMRVLLEQNPEIQVVGEADNGQDAVRLAASLLPDVIVLDCQLPDLEGPEVARRVRQQNLPIRMLALSAFDELKYIRGLLSAGATGYMLKNDAPETIVAAVQAVAAGRAYFSASVAAKLATISRPDAALVERPTPRELEVLVEVSKGLTNQEIARNLQISERTVRFHIENLFGRAQVESRTELAMKAAKLGWIA